MSLKTESACTTILECSFEFRIGDQMSSKDISNYFISQHIDHDVAALRCLMIQEFFNSVNFIFTVIYDQSKFSCLILNETCKAIAVPK